MDTLLAFYDGMAILLSLLLGAAVGLTVCANILDKKHNIGDSIGDIPDYSKEGITFYRSDDRLGSEPHLDSVHNPRIMRDVKTYQQATAKSLDEMIDSADLSNIQWHK